MKTLLLSSLTKVFKDKEPNFEEFTHFSCLKNEIFSFQLAFKPEKASETSVKVNAECELGCHIEIFGVENIPAGKNGYDYSDSFHYPLDTKEFPDLLMPSNCKTVSSGEWSAFWFEIHPNGMSGSNKIKITLTAGDTTTENLFSLDIINAELPKQKLLYTNWFHNDCLCTYYGVDIFSDEYWQIAENFIKNAVKYGMNMILTPVFTPPLDTEIGGERPTVQLVGVKKDGGKYTFGFKNFKKYIGICLKNGIEAFEISHFFTQWGAVAAPKIIATVEGEEKRIFGWETDANGEEYINFLTQFAVQFKKVTEELGIKDRCWLHISDEPSLEQIENYKKSANTISTLFPDFKTFDALFDIDFYKTGLVKTPICSEDTADIFKPEVENFWTYHCCGQVRNNLPNRLFSQPSQRNRILGILLYKYSAQGFLQWGHNFWYSQYSRYTINPFKTTDADNAFPSGDAFVVYPGDNKKPLNSLRNSVFAEALQDLRSLNLLESLTSREYVLNIIERGLDIPLTFTTYPREQNWLLNTRKQINNEIKSHTTHQNK